MEKYKHKVKTISGIKCSYPSFRKKYKNIYPDIDRRKYTDICYNINKRLSDKIIKESFEFRVPFKLGIISIKKARFQVKIKDGKLEKNKLMIDWAKTWDIWYNDYPGKSRKEINAIKNKQVVYHMNHHTNGYVMKWYWDKSICTVSNHSVYYFKPIKANRLNLAAWINSDEKENDYPLFKTYEERNAQSFIRELRKKRKAELEQEDPA